MAGVTQLNHLDRLQLSTSLIERNLIRHNRVFKTNLIVVKYYDDHLFHVTRPSVVDYYKQITEPVKDYICRIFDEN